MKRFKILTLSFLLLCAMGSGVVWLFGHSSVEGKSIASVGSETQSTALLGQLNEKAKAVKADNGASSRQLADEVFKTVGLDKAPAGMLDSVKDRLVNAEHAYHNGREKGISEINVVKAVNGLAMKFKAPEYAKTTKYEVRKLRMSMLALAPNFIGQERSADAPRARQIGSTINPDMSPMEAAFVTAMLLKQKVSNPDYQLTQTERRSKWNEKHSAKQTDKANRLNDQGNSARTQEMDKVIADGGSKLSIAELLNIPNRALDILGVQK